MGFLSEHKHELLLGVGLLWLLAAAFFAIEGSQLEAWRALQSQAGIDEPQLVERQSSQGVERCETCHFSKSEAGQCGELGLAHRQRDLSCRDCHGGSGVALRSGAAHQLQGRAVNDPLSDGWAWASCGQCHVPGSVAGSEELLAGVQTYSELGCGRCHASFGASRARSWGPDLRQIGRRTPAELREALVDPALDSPATLMPSFAPTFKQDPAAGEALLGFLVSAALPQRRDQSAAAQVPCSSCHAGVQGRAGGAFEHRCWWIQDQSERLECASCHAMVPTEPGKRCPLIEMERSNCALCHRAQ